MNSSSPVLRSLSEASSSLDGMLDAIGFMGAASTTSYTNQIYSKFQNEAVDESLNLEELNNYRADAWLLSELRQLICHFKAGTPSTHAEWGSVPTDQWIWPCSSGRSIIESNNPSLATRLLALYSFLFAFLLGLSDHRINRIQAND